MPWVEHRGDLTRDTPQDVAALVLEADPNAEAMVLWCRPALPGLLEDRQGGRPSGRSRSVSSRTPSPSWMSSGPPFADIAFAFPL